ncbi:MAG TPA: Maf family protein [Ignavibacteriales bacterium]|nr:Maf family protein [Ignavibacteriales bacterium]
MIQTDLPIYLASKSPRRRKLLKLLNIKFKAISVDLDEKIKNGEKPVDAVKRIASEKLDAARLHLRKGLIITADTVVVIDGKIIGKPKDEADAKRILRKLSGNTHEVFTGFALYNSKTGKKIVDHERTKVTFRKLDDNEIDEYIKSGSPMDKAGAYGIQDDYGAVFIEKISGCYYNVVGLPLARLYKRLKEITQVAY